MSLCGKISQANLIDCDNPLIGGTKESATIINHADVDITYGADGFTVEAITLAVGTLGYLIDGQNNSIVPRCEMVELGHFNMFDHEVIAKGFDISPAAKVDLNKAKDGRYIVLCENNDRGLNGEKAFEIYGIKTGLELTALTRQPNDADTQGAFDFTFFTKVNKEPKLPNPFFITDYTTTKALVDGLLV